MADEPLVLEGWKQIRVYLTRQGVRRSTSTIQKYAREFDLPVKKSAVTSIVYAQAEDLDEWILRYLIGKE